MANPFSKSTEITNAKTFSPSHLVLQEDAERLNWNKSLFRDRQISNAHWGQLKLCLTLIEFIITTVKFNPEKQVRIVYAGAANGRGTGIVATLFPWIQFDLFDTSQFSDTLLLMPNVSLFQSYFTDDCALIYGMIGNTNYSEGHERRQNLFSKTGIRHPSSIASEDIYFVSDIRRMTNTSFENEMADTNSELYRRFLREKSSTLDLAQAKHAFIENETEKAIMEDMNMQQKWVELMKPIACQLKCRMPYAIAGAAKYFNYLDGVIYFQPFVGFLSSETRLICERKDGEYTRKDYDILVYEQNLFAHNNYRITDKYRNILTGKVEHYIETELINNYDCTCAAFILKECFRSLHNRDPNSVELANFYILIVMKLSQRFDINSLAHGEGTLAQLYRGDIKISGLNAKENRIQILSTHRMGSISSENPSTISTIRVSLPL